MKVNFKRWYILSIRLFHRATNWVFIKNEPLRPLTGKDLYEPTESECYILDGIEFARGHFGPARTIRELKAREKSRASIFNSVPNKPRQQVTPNIKVVKPYQQRGRRTLRLQTN